MLLPVLRQPATNHSKQIQARQAMTVGDANRNSNHRREREHQILVKTMRTFGSLRGKRARCNADCEINPVGPPKR